MVPLELGFVRFLDKNIKFVRMHISFCIYILTRVSSLSWGPRVSSLSWDLVVQGIHYFKMCGKDSYYLIVPKTSFILEGSKNQTSNEFHCHDDSIPYFDNAK